MEEVRVSYVERIGVVWRAGGSGTSGVPGRGWFGRWPDRDLAELSAVKVSIANPMVRDNHPNRQVPPTVSRWERRRTYQVCE